MSNEHKVYNNKYVWKNTKKKYIYKYAKKKYKI